MDREPPLRVVCANLSKSANIRLQKLLQTFHKFFKNILLKYLLYIVEEYPFSLLKKDFFSKNVVLKGFFIAKISFKNERFVSYIIVRYSEQYDFVRF
jgi:hypothetical protein